MLTYALCLGRNVGEGVVVDIVDIVVVVVVVVVVVAVAVAEGGGSHGRTGNARGVGSCWWKGGGAIELG